MSYNYDVRHRGHRDLNVAERTKAGHIGAPVAQFCDQTTLRGLTCNSFHEPKNVATLFALPRLWFNMYMLGQINMPAASLDAVSFRKSFDQSHIYSQSDYCVRKTIFARSLKARRDRCCYITWFFVNVYCVLHFSCSSRLFPSQIGALR